ncbi:MAG: DUF2703 domain-containing protein [Clostridia bacterium]|nr:DUF2703 domain-containing protein [Clostridia bacterium]
MAKTWYPMIDYTICTECGLCVAKCPHEVYDKAKAPSPVVRRPESCVDHCHGCGNRCPAGAITYVGEDTEWTPPNRAPQEEEDGACGCKDMEKMIVIDYLYLDLETCERCIGTDQVLDEVMMTLTPAISMVGYKVVYNKTEMKTAAIAEQYKFLSSPTIRVNGRDICQSVSENNCGCCSEISQTDVDCRVFEYDEKTYEIPPKEMLAKDILNMIFGSADVFCSCQEYVLPENLKEFFDGKNRSDCSCKGDCC